ncbi:hypothetical protein J8I87_24510 [Paraburkholderia sp. LEh10]|nr:hypothetical protein [Paraburkholderia sp. LEh10]
MRLFSFVLPVSAASSRHFDIASPALHPAIGKCATHIFSVDMTTARFTTSLPRTPMFQVAAQRRDPRRKRVDERFPAFLALA